MLGEALIAWKALIVLGSLTALIVIPALMCIWVKPVNIDD